MLTLDQIKPEAERLFGGPLDVAMGDYRGHQVLRASVSGHGIDMDLNHQATDYTLEQFSQRILAPALIVLRARVAA